MNDRVREEPSTPIARDGVLGCLLGGAVGDALGAPVEFLSLAEIRREYGKGGCRDFAPAYGRRGVITDDAQMTLFTAEGLVRGLVRLGGRKETGHDSRPRFPHHLVQGVGGGAAPEVEVTTRRSWCKLR